MWLNDVCIYKGQRYRHTVLYNEHHYKDFRSDARQLQMVKRQAYVLQTASENGRKCCSALDGKCTLIHKSSAAMVALLNTNTGTIHKVSITFQPFKWSYFENWSGPNVSIIYHRGPVHSLLYYVCMFCGQTPSKLIIWSRFRHLGILKYQ